MRVLLRLTFPVEAGNKAVKDGSLPKIMETMLGELKPEAAYFLADHGKRTAYLFIDLKDPSQIPVVAEPFFMGLNADVEFIPAMNADELRAGLEKASKKF